MALGRAADFLKAEPGGNVLIIAVELPSLTFQRKDISQANLISFDPFWRRRRSRGGQRKTNAGAKILVSETYTFPIRWAPWDLICAIPDSTSCWQKMFRK